MTERETLVTLRAARDRPAPRPMGSGGRRMCFIRGFLLYLEKLVF